MEIFHNLEDYKKNKADTTITIGNFDGMHLGHQAVIDAVRKIPGKSCVITFKNHPIEVLYPEKKIERICTLDHKIKLLSEAKIDSLILLSFTKEFSKQTAVSFIDKLIQSTGFSYLILGHDATIGNQKKGDKDLVSQIAKQKGFSVHYLPPYKLDNLIISSSKVRDQIKSAHFENVKVLLGRPYSIYTKIESNILNINENLCLPPEGTYECQLNSPSNSLTAEVVIEQEPQKCFIKSDAIISGEYTIIF